MKPRIRQLTGNLWVCSAWWTATTGYGKTPLDAFKNWKDMVKHEA